MPKTAEQLRLEIVAWLRQNASNHVRNAMIGERKGYKAIQTAKADVYQYAADMVAKWDLGE